MTGSALTIGRLARAAGVNVETVRYYQRVGLIREPAKPSGGFRIYPPEMVDRIRFIKRSQKLGFTLQDIAHLLELGDGHCDDVREQAEAKISKIEAQIKDLQAMRKALKKLVIECRSGNHRGHCPIVQSLANKS
ncbi:MAG: Hg(II)-responsive transcriptional regulator [Gammaproteobacteria bacterium]|nr:Hg(II)-responsive transcriptional regulator [Gammaproteobacteria bacterium]